MKCEDELRIVLETTNCAVKKLVEFRHQWLLMAFMVHEANCGETRTHLWRACKNPICKRFLKIVKNDGRT